MRVGIVGAGVAGLTTAKVLKEAGHEVVVYDKAPDVGGVWSRTRRYPGLTTQSPKAQYSLSDFPMPSVHRPSPTGLAAVTSVSRRRAGSRPNSVAYAAKYAWTWAPLGHSG